MDSYGARVRKKFLDDKQDETVAKQTGWETPCEECNDLLKRTA